MSSKEQANTRISLLPYLFIIKRKKTIFHKRKIKKDGEYYLYYNDCRR